MIWKRLKDMSVSSRLSQISAALGLITLVVYCIYGAVYNYFDIVVFLAIAIGIVCAEVYVLTEKKAGEVLNLLAVICQSFGMGLFFLNSYPVWADRLNHISMYGSRGTLVPVITILIMLFACILIEIVSCSTLKRKDVLK